MALRRCAIILMLAAVRAGADNSLPVSGPLGLDAAGPEIGEDPSLRGPKKPPDQALLDDCRDYAEAHGITLDRFQRRFTGNRSFFFAPCTRTSDGGVLLVGTVGDGMVGGKLRRALGYVTRLDASWHPMWQRQLEKARFRTHEGMSGVVAPGGEVFVAIGGYVNPAVASVTWLVALDATGATRWEVMMPGAGTGGTACPQSLRLVDDGGVLLEGHSYPDAKAWNGERAHHWRGVVDRRGKLIVNQVGPPL